MVDLYTEDVCPELYLGDGILLVWRWCFACW